MSAKSGKPIAPREEQPVRRPAISRRDFLEGAGVVGAGVAGAAGLLASCTHPKEGGLNDTGETAPTSGVRIMPASIYAQSLLLALVPNLLISMVAVPPTEETPLSFDTSNLPVTGPLTAEGISSFETMAADLAADFIIVIDHDISCYEEALKEMCSRLGSCAITMDLDSVEVLTVLDLLAGELEGNGILVDDNRLRQINGLVATLQSTFPTIDDTDQEDHVSVYVGAGEDGLSTYGSETPIGRMVEAAGCDLFDTALEPKAAGSIVETDLFLSGSVPDMVLLASRDAAMDYLDEGGFTAFWRVTDMGRNNYVLPGLAGSSVWIDEMSPFAQETIGGAWLASLRRPDATVSAMADLVEQFYDLLYETHPAPSSDKDLVDTSLFSSLPIDKTTINRNAQERANQREADARALEQGLFEANDPSNFTNEELIEQFDAFARGMDVEPTDELRHKYLEELGRL